MDYEKKYKESLEEALKLANKMYLNSYECMWNDAMLYSLRNNCFYFYDPNIMRKTRKFGQKIAKIKGNNWHGFGMEYTNL